jgi:hypothetical protein
LLYSEFVVVFFVSLLTTMHLFGDMLLFAPMTTTLMYLVIVVVTINLI